MVKLLSRNSYPDPARFTKALLGVSLACFLGACEWVAEPEEIEIHPRIACGQQCIRTGDQCQKFLGTGQESSRFEYGSAWASHWDCKKKSGGDDGKANEVVCVPPATSTPPLDYCSKVVDECLAGCPVTREEVKQHALRVEEPVKE